jgi:hypothetical protein
VHFCPEAEQTQIQGNKAQKTAPGPLLYSLCLSVEGCQAKTKKHLNLINLINLINIIPNLCPISQMFRRSPPSSNGVSPLRGMHTASLQSCFIVESQRTPRTQEPKNPRFCLFLPVSARFCCFSFSIHHPSSASRHLRTDGGSFDALRDAKKNPTGFEAQTPRRPDAQADDSGQQHLID